MAVEEQRNEEAYKKLPLLVRATLRIIVILTKFLGYILIPHNLSPYFTLFDRSEILAAMQDDDFEEYEIDDDEDDDEGLLQ